MFSPAQLRTWTTAHLNSGAWYLDCSMTFTPLHEIDLKQSREALGVSAVDMVDLEAIEDEEAREKAVKKRAESDRKKAQKVKEAEEKAEQKEKDKQEKATEKAAEKAAEQGKGKGKKKSSEPGEDWCQSTGGCFFHGGCGIAAAVRYWSWYEAGFFVRATFSSSSCG